MRSLLCVAVTLTVDSRTTGSPDGRHDFHFQSHTRFGLGSFAWRIYTVSSRVSAMMRLSCLSLSYQNQFRTGKMDLPKFIREARALGFDGVDLHMQHLKSFDRIYLKQLRRMCLDNGLSVPSFPVSSEFGRTPPERIPAEIEKCRVGMETGLFLGAPLARLFVGSPPTPDKADEAFKRGVDALRQCAEIGADMGMV